MIGDPSKEHRTNKPPLDEYRKVKRRCHVSYNLPESFLLASISAEQYVHRQEESCVRTTGQRQPGTNPTSINRDWATGSAVLLGACALLLSARHPFPCKVSGFVSTWASQKALAVKSPPDNAGKVRDAGSIPVLGRSPRGGHGNPFQYCYLEYPMDKGGWRATVHRVKKSRTWLKCLSSMHMSPQKIHFWVLDKSPLLDPRRGLPFYNRRIPHTSSVHTSETFSWLYT